MGVGDIAVLWVLVTGMYVDVVDWTVGVGDVADWAVGVRDVADWGVC